MFDKYKKFNSGVQLKSEDPRDLFYEMLVGGGEWEEILAQIPKDFLLNFNKEWLLNQYKTDRCSFFASSSLYSFWNKTFLSPIYLSYFGKRISNLSYGAYTIDGVKALKAYSTCLYNLLPDHVCKKNSDYAGLKITNEMQQSAKQYSTTGYCRADGLFGNKFDSIRRFIFETKSPCIVTIPYYNTFNGTKDGGEFVKTKNSKLLTYHIVLCIGFTKTHYLFVDSFKRIVKMSKNIQIGESYGLLDFKREKITIPKKPATRKIKEEKYNAETLKRILYSKFAPQDKARATAGVAQNWFRMIDGMTYKGYTATDIVNWVYYLSRHGSELFDLTKLRSETLK